MSDIAGAILKYIKSRKYILLFSLIYFSVRLIFLNSYFLLRDERDLILTALSLAQTGKDLYGHTMPIVFSRISPQVPLLGMYWTIPFISFFHISLPIAVKVLYLFPTLFFPFFVFELIQSITSEKKLSYLTAFVVSFSPWYFHISRLAVEAHVAYFFCFLGLIFYLRKKRVFGLVFLLLSYFSYFGIRPFLLVIVPYVEFWMAVLSSRKQWKQTIVYILLFVSLFGCIYLLSSRIEQTSSRSNTEVIFLNKEKLSLETDFLRTMSDAPFSIRGLFDNKASLITHTLLNNFFKGVDFSYLFFSGDYVLIYANQVTGQFFPFLCIFFILGICFLAKKNKSPYFFIAGLTLVGLTSSLINSYSTTFSIRSIFSLIGVGFICGLGMIYMYELCRKKWKLFFGVGVVLLYFFFTTIFIYKYFFQNYHLINNFFNEGERYVAYYSKKNDMKTILVPNIHSYFLSYLVTVPPLSPKLFIQAHTELNKNNDYVFDGHRYHQCNAEQIEFASLGELPVSTIIEQSCLSASTKLLLEEGDKNHIIKLPDPQYGNNDINRPTKYYYFK